MIPNSSPAWISTAHTGFGNQDIGPARRDDEHGAGEHERACAVDAPATPPQLRQAEEEDPMQVDGASDDENEHGKPARNKLKRTWEKASEQAPQDVPATSDKPVFKRARTGDRSSSPQQAIQVFVSTRDRDFIDVVTKHGGSILDQDGDEILVCMPENADPLLEAELTDLMRRKAQLGLAFPDSEYFGTVSRFTLGESLETASRANDCPLVRRLLATSAGRALPREALEPILQAAMEAKADDAAICLRAAIARHVSALQAYDAARQAASSSSRNLAPPAGWQKLVNTSLSDAEIEIVFSSLTPGGDTERGMALLFGTEKPRPAGSFFVRRLWQWRDAHIDLLTGCGAVLIEAGESSANLMLYAADFDDARFCRELVAMQSEDPEKEDFEGTPGRDDSSIDSDDIEDSDERRERKVRNAKRQIKSVTTLMFAAQVANADLIRELLQTNATIDADDHNGMTALMYAVDAQNIEVVRLLLPYAADLGKTDTDEQTMLSIAAGNGNVALCELLLRHGAPLAPANETHTSALYAAAQAGRTDACIFLINEGADINRYAKIGPPPMTISFNAEVMNEIHEENHKWPRRIGTPLFAAAFNGHAETFRTLSALGARLDAGETAWYSLPSAAAQGGSIAIYEDLLRKGVHHSKSADFNLWPLQAAAMGNQTEMLRFLLDKGEDIEQQGSYMHSSCTAITQARRYNAQQAFAFLIERGARFGSDSDWKFAFQCRNPDLISRMLGRSGFLCPTFQLTLLQQATNSMSADNVGLLLKHGFNPNPTFVGLEPRENPLLFIDFAFNEHKFDFRSILRALVQNGAPLQHVNEKAEDVLILAAKHSNLAAVETLIELGARIGQADRKGKNALQNAADELGNSLQASPPSQFSEVQCKVLSTLLAAVSNQPDAFALATEAWYRTSNILIRDVIVAIAYLGMQCSTVIRTGKPFDPIHEKFLDSSLGSRIDSAALPAEDEVMKSDLKDAGMPLPLIDLMLPYLHALPAMAVRLFGAGEPEGMHRGKALRTGMLLNIHNQIVASAKSLAPYRDTTLGAKMEAILDQAAQQRLGIMVKDCEAEEALQAGCFSELFDLCLQATVPDMAPELVLLAQPPATGTIRKALLDRSIFAVLAEKIEAAWIAAWRNTATAQAADPDAPQPSSSPSTRSSTSSATAAAQPFSESIRGQALLTQFRGMLKQMLDTPGNGILDLPGASAEHAAIYSELVHRQLHMLAQFIDPGVDPAKTAAPASM